MNKPKIKAIIFDLGGVVVHGGYLNFVKHYCSGAMTQEGHKKIEHLEHQANLGDISETQFYKELQKTFDVHLTPKRMHKIITDNMQANKSLVNYLPKLKKEKVALFTNSIGQMAIEVLKMRHIPAKKLFDKVFISSKLHLAKPEQKAYEFAIKKLKVKPSEALMVDDRPQNVKAARKIGMHGIVFKNTAQFKKELKKYELA